MTSERSLIICTEKDAARIRHNPHFPNEWKSNLYFIPIKIHFLFGGHEQFHEMVMRHLATV
jgi:tetraacyldisaccharide 4'-kinase